MKKQPEKLPPQSQPSQPGHEHLMNPQPEYRNPDYIPSRKLEGKVALITGGDSGIGRAVSWLFAAEGARVMISYKDEDQDARETQNSIEEAGGSCELFAGDISRIDVCQQLIEKTVERYGQLDILVNNAAYQEKDEQDLRNIDPDYLQQVFSINVFSMFYLIKTAVPHMPSGSSIINTTSVVAYKGSGRLLVYSATKGAILSLTRALVEPLMEYGIRVNGVAPGPIWTPLIPSSFSPEEVSEFGKDTPIGRPGQPSEVSPSFLFLASDDSSYITGQVIHPNGGTPVGG